MTSPKPTPPKKPEVSVSVEKPEAKRPYVRSPHLTNRPFGQHDGLKALREELNVGKNKRKTKKVGR